jgi:hypothetical protein
MCSFPPINLIILQNPSAPAGVQYFFYNPFADPLYTEWCENFEEIRFDTQKKKICSSSVLGSLTVNGTQAPPVGACYFTRDKYFGSIAGMKL